MPSINNLIAYIRPF